MMSDRFRITMVLDMVPWRLLGIVLVLGMGIGLAVGLAL